MRHQTCPRSSGGPGPNGASVFTATTRVVITSPTVVRFVAMTFLPRVLAGEPVTGTMPKRADGLTAGHAASCCPAAGRLAGIPAAAIPVSVSGPAPDRELSPAVLGPV